MFTRYGTHSLTHDRMLHRRLRRNAVRKVRGGLYVQLLEGEHRALYWRPSQYLGCQSHRLLIPYRQRDGSHRLSDTTHPHFAQPQRSHPYRLHDSHLAPADRPQWQNVNDTHHSCTNQNHKGHGKDRHHQLDSFLCGNNNKAGTLEGLSELC